MSQMHTRHPEPHARDEFLVDGCPRCAEYAAEMGIHFAAARFREFWAMMVEVEFDDRRGYKSQLDKALGGRLYLVALGLQRAYGLDPHDYWLAGHLAVVRGRE